MPTRLSTIVTWLVIAWLLVAAVVTRNQPSNLCHDLVATHSHLHIPQCDNSTPADSKENTQP